MAGPFRFIQSFSLIQSQKSQLSKVKKVMLGQNHFDYYHHLQPIYQVI